MLSALTAFRPFPFFLSIALVYLCCAPSTWAAAAAQYELAVGFSPAKNLLTGKARIHLKPGENLRLSFDDLMVASVTLKQGTAPPREIQRDDNSPLSIPAEDIRRSVDIDYSKWVDFSYDNIISGDHIILTSNWHPQIERKMTFTLSATVPKGFRAIAESDTLPTPTKNNTYRFSLSQPVMALHFAAAPYNVTSQLVRNGLQVHTFFFKQDKGLAAAYLAAATAQIKRYEKEIGPFPYKHYAMVANPLPMGYGLPTFSLLSRNALASPATHGASLKHEILHSWFGNGVVVDQSAGNWAEGLITFLDSTIHRGTKEEARAERKASITTLMSYVHATTAIPLSSFKFHGHNQPMARAIRAVGYDKSVLLFHELKERIGAKKFSAGLRNFYRSHKGGSASWKDLQAAFEQASAQSLTTFFTEKLSRTDLPRFELVDIKTIHNDQGVKLNFTVEQRNETPFHLKIPIRVETGTKRLLFTQEISKKTTAVSLKLDALPLRIEVDPDYTLLRSMGDAERYPVWAAFIGAEKKKIVLESEQVRERFSPIIDLFHYYDVPTVMAAELTNKDLAEGSFLFLGVNNPLSRALFAMPPHPQEGFTLDVRTNPLNSGEVVALVSSASEQEAYSAARQLAHYDESSYLHFKAGRMLQQRTELADPSSGYTLEQLPTGVATTARSAFDKIVDELAQSRVVYIGETHTSLGDHMLQYRIIQALHDRDPQLVLGMEMFPRSSQPALDAYLNKKSPLSEKDFLRQSRYFEVWRYDWRYYKNIFHLAKKNTLPVIGLNLDKEIVSTIYKSGDTDSLSDQQRDMVPTDRDLGLPGYTTRLKDMYALHAQDPKSQGVLSGFIQSQAAWDEAMAKAISDYLKKHPKKKMVVLAGSQHTRKDSGIPPRVARRINVQQASVVTAKSGMYSDRLEDLFDYLFYTEEASLPAAPKIGVVLAQATNRESPSLVITRLSPHGKAAAAGIMEQDILLSINNEQIRTMEDVQLALFDAQMGDMAQVQIERKGEKDSVEVMEFTVELTAPTMAKPHP